MSDTWIVAVKEGAAVELAVAIQKVVDRHSGTYRLDSVSAYHETIAHATGEYAGQSFRWHCAILVFRRREAS